MEVTGSPADFGMSDWRDGDYGHHHTHFSTLDRVNGSQPALVCDILRSRYGIALITPPMAINFFLVKNVFKISSGDLLEGVLPYLAVLVTFLFILVAYPPLSIWLPGLMIGK